MIIVEKGRVFIKYVVLFLLFAALFSYAMFQGGFVSWFLFYSVTTVIICTIAIAFFPFRIRKIERNIDRHYVWSNDEVKITIVVEKPKWQPFFFVRIEDHSPHHIGEAEPGALFFFSFANELRFSYSLRELKRGVYDFTYIEFVFSDLFGFVERKKKLPVKSRLYVFPKINKRPKISLLRRVKSVEGRHFLEKNKAHRSIAGVREYERGDRLASIDWKQSARYSKLMTKEYESFEDEEMIIVFNAFAPHTSKENFEQTIELAASLMAEMAVQSTVQVSIWSNGWSETIVSESTLTHGLTLFAQVEKANKQMAIDDPAYLRWRGAVVYIVSMKVDKQFVQTCIRMKKLHIRVIVCLFAVTRADRLLVDQLRRNRIEIYSLKVD